MAFSAKDGKNYTNADTARSHGGIMQAQAPPAAEPDVNEAQQGPPPIESDPEAMQCVQILQQKGYTADDVEQAMGQSEGQEHGGGAPPEMGAM